MVLSDKVPDDDRREGEVVSRAYEGPGEWLGVRQACVRLGISERSLYRRVNAGRLTKRPTQGGGVEVYVPLPGAAPETAPDVPDVPDTTPDDGALLLVERIVSPLHRALVDLIRRNAELERENGHLAERLAATEDRLRALEAPREAPADGPESYTARNLTAQGPEPTPGGEPPEPGPEPTPPPVRAPIPPGPDGRSWWRRWWRALLSAPG